MSARIGFIGLGVMGAPMASHIAAAGHALRVFDINPAPGHKLAVSFANVESVESPREVATFADIVITMLPSGEYVQAVALGERGLIAGFSGGELLVDTSSSEPDFTVNTASALAEKGVDTLDAPTSGAEMGAIAGELVFMVGGKHKDLERARPLLNCMGNKLFHLGPLGSGHRMKSINNLITAMTFLATAEGLALGTKLGLDPNVMTDVMNECTSMSWISRTHIKQRIINRAFDDPFKLALMVKDIRIALELAEQEHVSLPFSELGQSLWKSAEKMAEPEASVSDLVRWVEKTTGSIIK